MKKISSEDCIKEIDRLAPGRKWKRVSKKTIVEREFEVVGDPATKFLVREDGGKLTASAVAISKGSHSPRRMNSKAYYFKYAQDMEDEYRFDNSYLPKDELENGFYPNFYIVSKDFWDREKHLDDGVNMSNVKMPKGFAESMEGCFGYNGTKEQGIKELLAAGFIPLPETDNTVYFQVMEVGGKRLFGIVSKKYWEDQHCLDDFGIEVKMPRGFEEVEESLYEYHGNESKGVKLLLDAKFLPIPPERLDFILFAIKPGVKDGKPTEVWFAGKKAFLTEAPGAHLLELRQRVRLFDSLREAHIRGIEISDGTDGYSLVYELDAHHMNLRKELLDLGLVDDPKYCKWVDQR